MIDATLADSSKYDSKLYHIRVQMRQPTLPFHREKQQLIARHSEDHNAKADLPRKLVELDAHHVHADHGCRSDNWDDDAGISEALLNSRVRNYCQWTWWFLYCPTWEPKSCIVSLYCEKPNEEIEKGISEKVVTAMTLKLLKLQVSLDLNCWRSMITSCQMREQHLPSPTSQYNASYTPGIICMVCMATLRPRVIFFFFLFDFKK